MGISQGQITHKWQANPWLQGSLILKPIPLPNLGAKVVADLKKALAENGLS